MKKIALYIFSVLMLSAGLTSCNPESDDVFDENSSVRIDKAKAEVKSILEAAPNGWRMEYFGDAGYGGYNIFLKFSGDSVLVGGESAGSSHPAGIDSLGNAVTSPAHYSLNQSQGVTLSFDEYNGIFHYFSDPVNADYGYNGEGFEGDLEFNVITCTADSIIMTGKKHGQTIRMYPMPEGTTWGDYISEVASTETYMASAYYQLQLNEENIKATCNQQGRYRNMAFSYFDENNDSIAAGYQYIVTPEGIKFYNGVTISGVKINGFEKGDTEEYFYVKGDHSMRAVTYVMSLYEQLISDSWYISYEDLGEYAKPYWDSFRNKLKTSGTGRTKERVYYSYIGATSYVSQGTETVSGTGICVMAGSHTLVYGINMEALNSEGNEVKLSQYSAYCNKDGQKYYSSYGLNQALRPIAGGSGGHTYTLTTDNQRHPGYILLTDKAYPTNVIKLHSTMVLYTFGDLDADATTE